MTDCTTGHAGMQRDPDPRARDVAGALPGPRANARPHAERIAAPIEGGHETGPTGAMRDRQGVKITEPGMSRGHGPVSLPATPPKTRDKAVPVPGGVPAPDPARGNSLHAAPNAAPNAAQHRAAPAFPRPVLSGWAEALPPAPPRRANRTLWLSFALCVLAPLFAVCAYLWGVAADQYASTVAFSVRREEPAAAAGLIGGLIGLSAGSSSDTDILYEFIQSQDMVQRLDAGLSLRAIYAPPKPDPVFALRADAPVEDLRDHWRRMTNLSYDPGTGMIELRVLAFTPADATRIAAAAFDECAALVNDLTRAAREDATRLSQEELDRAEDRLRAARAAVTGFRNAHQLVDPEAELQGRMTVLDTLNAALAEARVERESLLRTTRPGDPRIIQRNDRIAAIETQITAERGRLGLPAVSGTDRTGFAGLVGEYEQLVMEREFAEQSYLSAAAAHEAAQLEARRLSRYLAAHVRPTSAETAEYPRRVALAGIAALFLTLGWAACALLAAALRDRR